MICRWWDVDVCSDSGNVSTSIIAQHTVWEYNAWECGSVILNSRVEAFTRKREITREPLKGRYGCSWGDFSQISDFLVIYWKQFLTTWSLTILTFEMDMGTTNSVFVVKKLDEIVLVKLVFCISTDKHTRIYTFIEVGKHYLNRVFKKVIRKLMSCRWNWYQLWK